jgi:hypothetical protein
MEAAPPLARAWSAELGSASLRREVIGDISSLVSTLYGRGDNVPGHEWLQAPVSISPGGMAALAHGRAIAWRRIGSNTSEVLADHCFYLPLFLVMSRAALLWRQSAREFAAQVVLHDPKEGCGERRRKAPGSQEASDGDESADDSADTEDLTVTALQWVEVQQEPAETQGGARGQALRVDTQARRTRPADLAWTSPTHQTQLLQLRPRCRPRACRRRPRARVA